MVCDDTLTCSESLAQITCDKIQHRPKTQVCDVSSVLFYRFSPLFPQPVEVVVVVAVAVGVVVAMPSLLFARASCLSPYQRRGF